MELVARFFMNPLGPLLLACLAGAVVCAYLGWLFWSRRSRGRAVGAKDSDPLPKSLGVTAAPRPDVEIFGQGYWVLYALAKGNREQEEFLQAACTTGAITGKGFEKFWDDFLGVRIREEFWRMERDLPKISAREQVLALLTETRIRRKQLAEKVAATGSAVTMSKAA